MIISHQVKEMRIPFVRDYERIFGIEWEGALMTTLKSEYMSNLQCFIRESYRKSDKVFPRNQEDVFRALELTRPRNIRVVLFGDAPATSVQSNGLAFGSFKPGRGVGKLNQTIKIEKCLSPNGIVPAEDFDPTLRTWARQGVLLLNTSLISNIDPVQNEKYQVIFRNLIREIINVVNEKNSDCIFVFTSKDQVKHFSKYVDLTFNHMLYYDGIDEDSSIFEDINTVIEQNNSVKDVIQW